MQQFGPGFGVNGQEQMHLQSVFQTVAQIASRQVLARTVPMSSAELVGFENRLIDFIRQQLTEAKTAYATCEQTELAPLSDRAKEILVKYASGYVASMNFEQRSKQLNVLTDELLRKFDADGRTNASIDYSPIGVNPVSGLYADKIFALMVAITHGQRVEHTFGDLPWSYNQQLLNA